MNKSKSKDTLGDEIYDSVSEDVFQERRDIVMVARYLRTGKLSDCIQILADLHKTYSELRSDLGGNTGGDSVPVEYAEYCGVPTECLKSFSAFYKALLINRTIFN